MNDSVRPAPPTRQAPEASSTPEEPVMYLPVSRRAWFSYAAYEGLGRHRRPDAAMWRKLTVAAVLLAVVTW